ncbi:MAG: hypothetical protein D6731_26120 [Planctomycetota bacterium]|nr:MAG: hypothetical protein D6731_26120 [Planctomycetota bacterium]
MMWHTLEDATELGPSREAWLARVEAGEVSSYVDAWGRRWVWVEVRERAAPGAWALEEEVLPLWREVAALRREVLALRRRAFSGAPAAAAPGERTAPPAGEGPRADEGPRAEASSPAPRPAKGAAPGPAGPPAPAPERVLALRQERWPDSDRALERAAGLPKAFLAKAKKGQRGGPRSARTWRKLEAFLLSLPPASQRQAA